MLKITILMFGLLFSFNSALAVSQCGTMEIINLTIKKRGNDHLLQFARKTPARSWTVVDNDGILSLSVLLEHINYVIEDRHFKGRIVQSQHLVFIGCC